MTAGTQPASGRQPVARPAAPIESGRWRPTRLATTVLLVGALVTAGLTIAASSVYDNNEDRLIKLRVRELGLVLTTATANVQAPLTSAVELAEATDGDAARFRAFMAPYVGRGRQFASASLWTSDGDTPRSLVTVGASPALAATPGRVRQAFELARRARSLAVVDLLREARPRLGYALRKRGGERYVVYAENPLPRDRRSTLARNAAFSQIDYAIYLGRSQTPSKLLLTSLEEVPSEGRRASQTTPFGNTALSLLAVPHGSLGGAFFQRLPLIIAVVGSILAAIAALLTDRLIMRRHQAERLADVLDYVAAENHQLYTEQRSIAQTLQHTMLPDALPELAGTRVSARYVPAASGIEVGGDWYDVVALDDDRLLVLIGDVSGHGLEASTTMAALRHAALAYVAQDSQPATVLAKLADFSVIAGHGYFATVLCALIDLERHALTVATAGHPPPLLFSRGEARYVDVAVGPPVGAPRGAGYRDTTTPILGDAALLAFTDGLVERRTEVIDIGLERVRHAAERHGPRLDELIESLVAELESGRHDDDAAIVGVRWRR